MFPGAPGGVGSQMILVLLLIFWLLATSTLGRACLAVPIYYAPAPHLGARKTVAILADDPIIGEMAAKRSHVAELVRRTAHSTR